MIKIFLAPESMINNTTEGINSVGYSNNYNHKILLECNKSSTELEKILNTSKDILSYDIRDYFIYEETQKDYFEIKSSSKDKIKSNYMIDELLS